MGKNLNMAGLFSVARSKVVMQRLDGVDTRVLDFAGANLLDSAFRHAGDMGELRKLAPLNRAQIKNHGRENIHFLSHRPYCQPKCELSQPAHGLNLLRSFQI